VVGERNLGMNETFWFVRLDEGEMWKNAAWKWQKCRGKVEEGDGDMNPVCKYYGKRSWKSISSVFKWNAV